MSHEEALKEAKEKAKGFPTFMKDGRKWIKVNGQSLPKDHYPEDSYERQNWPEDIWDKRKGAADFIAVLKGLLPYTSGEYDIRLFAV